MNARYVFVTGHEFGRRALEGLLASEASLEGRLDCGALIELDRSRTAATVGFSSAADLAEQHSIPVEVTTDGSLRSLERVLREIAPHYLLVVGWSRLVAGEILDLPAALHGGPGDRRSTSARGCIGMHPTRLPEGRGQAPIPWTIIRGLRSSALSVFNLEDGADTGAILAQYDLEVRDRETSASLFSRFSDLHFHAGLDLGERLAARDASGRPQDDSVATVWAKRRPADGLISPALTPAELDALVRALTGPYPRAFVRIGDDDIRVEATRLVGSSHVAALGAITAIVGDELLVAWSGGALIAIRVDQRDLVRATQIIAAGQPLVLS